MRQHCLQLVHILKFSLVKLNLPYTGLLYKYIHKQTI